MSTHNPHPDAAPGVRPGPTPEEFSAMARDPQFLDLKKTYRGFTFPLAVAFFLWFILYVLSAIYFPEFMARPFVGMNVGIWFGIAQFVTTFAITWAYVIFANKQIEPRSSAIREAMEA